MRWVIGAVLAALLLAGCSSSGEALLSVGGHDRNVAKTTHHIVYTLSGTARAADVTFVTPDGSTDQRDHVAVPMGGIGYEIDPGGFLYISAQNTGRSGSLTCTITEDGVEVARHTSVGGYSTVTCQASA